MKKLCQLFQAKVSGSKSDTNFEEALQEETMGANSEPRSIYDCLEG
jgi:hypothetical protein